MVDTNVFFQDSVRLVQRLIELRKENWEIAPYPGREPRLHRRDELGRRVQAHPEAVRRQPAASERDRISRRPWIRTTFSISSVSRARCSKGHFRCRPGCTAPGYLQCALVLQHPAHAEALGRALGDELRDARRRRSCCRRRSAASIIGHEVGARARRARDLRRAPGRRADAAPRLHARARPIASSSSRTSSRPADRRARRWRWPTAAGATVVGAGVDHRSQRRQRRTSTCRSRRSSRSTLPTYQPDACPLCAAGQPVVKPGSQDRDRSEVRGQRSEVQSHASVTFRTSDF